MVTNDVFIANDGKEVIGFMVLDTCCKKSVAGVRWHRGMRKNLKQCGLRPVNCDLETGFRFGDGREIRLKRTWCYPCLVHGKAFTLEVAEIQEDCLSVAAMTCNVPIVSADFGHPQLCLWQDMTLECQGKRPAELQLSLGRVSSAIDCIPCYVVGEQEDDVSESTEHVLHRLLSHNSAPKTSTRTNLGEDQFKLSTVHWKQLSDCAAGELDCEGTASVTMMISWNLAVQAVAIKQIPGGRRLMLQQVFVFSDLLATVLGSLLGWKPAIPQFPLTGDAGFPSHEVAGRAALAQHRQRGAHLMFVAPRQHECWNPDDVVWLATLPDLCHFGAVDQRVPCATTLVPLAHAFCCGHNDATWLKFGLRQSGVWACRQCSFPTFAVTDPAWLPTSSSLSAASPAARMRQMDIAKMEPLPDAVAPRREIWTDPRLDIAPATPTGGEHDEDSSKSRVSMCQNDPDWVSEFRLARHSSWNQMSGSWRMLKESWLPMRFLQQNRQKGNCWKGSGKIAADCVRRNMGDTDVELLDERAPPQASVSGTKGTGFNVEISVKMKLVHGVAGRLGRVYTLLNLLDTATRYSMLARVKDKSSFAVAKKVLKSWSLLDQAIWSTYSVKHDLGREFGIPLQKKT
eukprot:6211809-Amphidinium_carterae.3